ncbi:type VI secretion system membrane subunit TssM [Pseudoduganella sp. GCM10020061]|uniref:type VI secretion system membrane subunit TssM n=1 Tax=Pseudoduganella sp. GCM10020061 TaxID=3317345 RepID=UPI00362B6D7A
MRRLWQFLTHRWVKRTLVLTLACAVALLVTEVLEITPLWGIGSVLLAAALWALAVHARRRWRERAADPLAKAIAEPCNDARDEVPALRKAMLDAVGTIKSSRLGIMRGSAAMYELPWYMIIGNPAAGKSSAIAHSGLSFPLAGSRALHGVGGTRNCDWFFTTEGIVLDTAGRYSVEDSDRAEWLAFLGLLRRYRPRAPVNGIIIAASVADLIAGPPQKNLELARNLRSRVQELTEHLGVYAPVYVVFTKADLVAGFCDFFHGAQGAERDRTWGATLRYNRRRAHQDVLAFFDEGFDELHEGLKEMSLASMGMAQAMRPGVFTFPLEFASMKPVLRAFLATLFEENTYQFRPVFRGFYFTSALQEGSVANHASERVAARFDVELPKRGEAGEAQDAGAGYFLRDLFRSIIFADKDLVARYTTPTATRIKYGAFACAALALGVALAGWSWSYSNNRQLVANVEADLAKVVRLQDKRTDLQSRLEALEVLQDRIQQLEHYRADTPLMLSFGLYQGDTLERKLRDEFFAGMRDVMVRPVGAALEAHLAAMNAHGDQLDPATQERLGAGTQPGQPYQDGSPTNVADGYNALKTYLMLGDKSHAETGHLHDQLTRFWRGWLHANRGAMPEEQLIRSAEKLLTFHIANVEDPAWPQLQPKIALLDTARENLRRVVRGIPARERAYADIRARASTRYPAVTVARLAGERDAAFIAGSHAVPGAFTREAWDGYVRAAIRDAANRELASTDWVLRTTTQNDLTLEGSPEQIEKALTDLYKADYVRQWNTFLQGVTLAGFDSFDGGVRAMNRLGDPQSSPISRVLAYVHEQTAWDAPGGGGAATAKVQKGVIAWLREKILRRAPSDVRTGVDAAGLEIPSGGAAPSQGRIAREFSGLARMVAVREKEATLMTGYLDALSRLRTRLNQIRNQGDPGPGARQFMQQTLEGSGSELAEALKFVDEQMLTGMSDEQKQALRPILVRPLMQSFGVVIAPSESEINRTWMAQVVEPFRASLASKYPFSPRATIQASPAEIGQVFGPDGVVAKFVSASLGSLVVRRGDLLEPRRWADMGIEMNPGALAGFRSWVAPLEANGVAGTGGVQNIFQIRPLLSPGVQEFTVEIDGQQLRYRNTPPTWTSMVHPGPGVRGFRISAVLVDGRTVDVFNEAGPHALGMAIEQSDQVKRGAYNELRWKKGNVSVALDFKKVISSEGAGGRGFVGMALPDAIVGRPPEQVAVAGGAQ